MARAYIYGDGQKYKTPEELAKANAVANAMLLNMQAPRDVGSGLNAIAQALMYRGMMGDIADSQKAGSEAAAAAFNPVAGAFSGPSAFPPAPGAKVAAAMAGKSKQVSDNPNLPSRLDFRRSDVAGDFSPQQRALIDTIYGPESRGKYNVMYGGGTFDDMSDHPRQYHTIMSGPNAGKKSSAAGAGQFLASTWDDQAKKLGLTDFSALSQDKATLNLARESYQNATGGNLDEALASGDPKTIAAIGRTLAPVWTSLPGGIEQGIGSDAFVSAYNRNLGGAAPAPAAAAANKLATGQPVQVASLDPSIGISQQPAAPPLPAPRMVQDRPIADMPPAPQQPPVAPKQSPQVAQAGQFDQSRLPAAAGGTADAFDASQGPSMQVLINAANQPFLNDNQAAFVNALMQQKLAEQDPLRQLQLEKLRREIATPQKDWTRLDDHTLFRPSTGETKRVDGGKPNLFEGTSLDAQAWNILQNTDPSSREYATAYSIVAQPKQQLVQTADGLVPVLVPPQLPSWLKAPGGSPDGQAGPVAPQGTAPGAPAMQQQSNAATPQSAPQGSVVAGTAIPGTVKPTETQRNRVSNVNQAFETINGELDRYADLVKRNGIEVMPGEGKDNLNTVRQGIMLQMKELFNLGVLNGPDLSLMERMIYDPVVDVTKEGGLVNLPSQLWTGVTGGADERARNSVSELKRMLGNIKASAAQSIAAPGQQQAAPPPPGGIVDYRTYFGGAQ